MPIRRLLILAYAAALGAACGAVAFIELAGDGWVGEMLANLRLHLAMGSALLAIAALLLPLQWLARLMVFVLGSGLAAGHVLPLLPYVAQPPPAALQARPDAATLRILVANLRSWATNLVALEKLLRDSRADIVLLTEITPHQQRVFQVLRTIYPEQFETPIERDNTFAIRILARQHMEIELYHPVVGDHPVLQARFCASGEKCLTLLSVHAPRPGPAGRQLRNTVLQGIVAQTRLAQRRGDHVIAAGDFNITAFSPDFGMFGEAGLSDSGLGRGYPSTWPYFLPNLGLGIDHVLVSPGIGVAARWLGPDIRSDHYPLFVELKIPRER
jgi:endonuclease/exonuclease/phosphatase (EEP) superfamily protein YafD